MIVERHRAHQILAGKITEHRLPRHHRPPQPGQRRQIRPDNTWADIAGHVTITASHLSRNRTHPPGDPCPHATHGDQPGAGLCICPETSHHATLTPEALHNLGHPTLQSYIRAWLLDRDQAWLATRPATVAAGPHATTTTAAAHGLTVLDDEQILTRWQHRHADRPVWVIHWQPCHDQPVWLQAGIAHTPYATRPNGQHVIDDGIRDEDRGYTGPGVRPIPESTDLNDRGYTDQPARGLTDAGETINPALLRLSWTTGADHRHTAARPGQSRPPGTRPPHRRRAA